MFLPSITFVATSPFVSRRDLSDHGVSECRPAVSAGNKHARSSACRASSDCNTLLLRWADAPSGGRTCPLRSCSPPTFGLSRPALELLASVPSYSHHSASGCPPSAPARIFTFTQAVSRSIPPLNTVGVRGRRPRNSVTRWPSDVARYIHLHKPPMTDHGLTGRGTDTNIIGCSHFSCLS